MAISPKATRHALDICRFLGLERAVRNLPQSYVAARVGISQSAVSASEMGKHVPHLDKALALAWALDLDLALVAKHHLPLLDLTADEVDDLIGAARVMANSAGGPRLLAALDKLTPADGEAAA